MRREFLKLLHAHMRIEPFARFLAADIGYSVLDDIRRDYPKQFTDFGAAEQLMIGAAVGLALSGLKPFCYSITPFLLYRPFEWHRNFLQNDRIPVKLIGVGRGKDYEGLGFTHWSEDDAAVLAALPNIAVFRPTPRSLEDDFYTFVHHPGPAYINLTR